MKWLNVKFLDANVLAYAFYSNENTNKCQAAIKEGGITDTFGLIEAFRVIEKETGSRERAQGAIKGLLKSSIEVIDVDVNAVFEALKQVGLSRLSIFDSVHYACAAISHCSSILSYDKDFDRLEIPREEP
ncbi:PIN domain-containing protein [Candidatus Woesearchaeota archaeon]|nr:PIN domain-containing protein [Candidatus Woesearchaeota archaeon]